MGVGQVAQVEAAVNDPFSWQALAVTVLAVCAIVAWIHVTRRKP